MHHMTHILADLPFDVGVTESDGTRSSDGREGYLSFGPYVSLPPGRYFGGFQVRRTGRHAPLAAVTIDVAYDNGNTVVGTVSVPAEDLLEEIAGLVGLEFTLGGPRDLIEMRLHTSEGLQLNVTQLKLFRTS